VKERHGRASKQTAADEAIRDHDAIAQTKGCGDRQRLDRRHEGNAGGELSSKG
jgi:hypothetical protein